MPPPVFVRGPGEGRDGSRVPSDEDASDVERADLFVRGNGRGKKERAEEEVERKERNLVVSLSLILNSIIAIEKKNTKLTSKITTVAPAAYANSSWRQHAAHPPFLELGAGGRAPKRRGCEAISKGRKEKK